MPFQSTVRRYLAPGVKGGWASANPHASLLQSNDGDLAEGAAPIAVWSVGLAGVIIGNFAFADTSTGLVTSNGGPGAVMTPTTVGTIRVGFVQRDQLALITPYLGTSTVTLYQGQNVTLLAAGDVWAQFAAGAAVGQFVFASFADGSAIAQATTTPPTTTYSVTTTSGQPTLTGVGAGAAVGQPITGTGIPANTVLIAYNAAAGTATMSQNASASATVTATGTTAVLTRWRVNSPAANGDIAKISVQGN